MKNVQIDKNSWHYELYSAWGSGWSNQKTYDTTDICHYMRHFSLGVLFCLFVIALGVVAGMLLLDPIISFGLWAITDLPIFGFFHEVMFAFGCFGYILIAFVYGIEYTVRFCRDILQRRKKQELENMLNGVEPNSSFISLLSLKYKAFKDKVCYTVTFK